MWRKIFFVYMLCALLLPLTSYASGITNYAALIKPEYWNNQNEDGNRIILTDKEIIQYNKKIREASPTVFDMGSYPEEISGDALKTKIMNYTVLDDELYLHGNKVSENYKNILRKQTNISAVPERVKVRYAVTVRRANLRNLPTGEGLFYFINDRDFDALQETTIDPAEPVAVLHASANGYFYYIQSVNYSGWISKYDVAFTDRGPWMKYADPDKFLIVQNSMLKLKTAGEFVDYQLGAKLPIEDVTKTTYIMELPTRNAQGNLVETEVFIAKNNNSVHYGYLPYTANNIVSSAFKFYNQPYGWGGLKNSVDCSSLIYNVYRAAGIILPRNADEQERTAGAVFNLKGLSASGKRNIINGLQAGSALFIDGHTMLYLGENNGQPYAIHALGTYYKNGSRIREMRIVVSDLSLQRYSGLTFLEDLNTAISFR